MLIFLPLAAKCQTFDVPVKRVHSRQRRFIAPGAVWDLLVGVEVIGKDFEFRYDNVIHYRMDYLFGGFEALTGAIADAQAAAAATAGRKKRLVDFFILFLKNCFFPKNLFFWLKNKNSNYGNPNLNFRAKNSN